MMAFDNQDRADILAMMKFPLVKFDMSKGDFSCFSRSLHRRIGFSPFPSAGGLKRLRPLKLEAAIYKIYSEFCAAKSEFDRERMLARDIMQTTPENIIKLDPGFFGSIDWARARLLSEGNQYGKTYIKSA